MKKLIIGVVITLFLCGTVFDARAQETKFFGLEQGPLLHGTTTMVMAITINQWCKRYGKIEEDYGVFSVGIPLLALWMNEYTDYKWGRQDDYYKDLAYGFIGAITGKLLCYTF